ncbi:MAG: phenolic acid decarboxylase subunit B [Rhodospirillaceae bacterium TMED167]|nr:phenolic acid decarboxylase subunit B [Rhodospirillaceae bacterium]OUW28846.1 MAG: phenolic acid decarboxylase subunit B [Rhodospirillaceae bacterium TMED167]
MSNKNLIVGMTGASGAIFGVRLLEALRDTDVTSHLVFSKWAHQTLEHETTLKLDDLKGLADVYYAPGEMGAKVSSGSFITDGMVILPCSVKSLAAIANGLGEHLVHRAADVILKERRPLVLVVRETPLNDIHLENMLKLSRMGVTIMPPVPAFYNYPENIDDIVNHIVGRVLDQFHIKCEFEKRWDGGMKTQPPGSQQP